MRSLCVLLAAVAGSVLLCSPVRGGLSTSTFSFSVDQANYNVLPSLSVGVPVYLREDVTPAIPPNVSFLEEEAGLFSAGVLVQRTGTLGDPAVIRGVSPNDTDFDDYYQVTFSKPAAWMSVYEISSSGAPAKETFSDSGVFRILLGTFSLKAGATVGEVTTFNVDILGAGFDGTTTWLGTSLDGSINSTSFTVTTVPVPSAVLLGLLGFGAGGLGLWRGRAHRV